MTTALLDGDTLIYAASSASEYETQWDEWFWTLHADLEEAITKLRDLVHGIEKATECESVIFALSDDDRWRPRVMPTYKGNRKTRKPVVYKALRQYVHETYKTFQRPSLEGDDILGILATHPTIVPGDRIVVAIDKDMKQVPGKHYHYGKDSEIHTITEAEADYFHMYQTLTGDATDGYTGCPGVGPKSAEKILAPFKGPNAFDVKGAWEVVRQEYAKKLLGQEVALMNARVARILRHNEYDFKQKEVILWQPE